MRRTAIAALLCFTAAVPLAAQSLTGTIAGIVKDEQGGVLPGVTVTLSGRTAFRTATTDDEGRFRFVAVDPGTYSVTATLSGFRAKRQDNVAVSVSRVVGIPLVLGVGGLTDEVDVVGEAPVVDATSSATFSALSQDMLFNLPIRPTNAAQDLLNYVPGVNDGVAYGGNSDYGNGLLIDGVDTRDPEAGSAWVFFNFNLVDEVQVGGLGANAEYGAYTGAVVNTITKSGGNRHTGLFDAYWTATDFSADNVEATYVEQNPTLKEPFVVNKRLDLTAQLGGPLVKDRLFFFLAAQRFEQKDDPSGPRTLHTEKSPRINGKLTWQPGPNDTVSATFQWDYYNQTGRPTIDEAVNGDDQTVNQDSPEAVWGLQWRHLFGARTFAEVKYSGWWGYDYLDPEVPVPLSFDGSTNSYSGGSLSHYHADRGRHQVNASISHYAEAYGKHDLKFGVEIERSKVRSRRGYNQGIYYYNYTAAYPPGQYVAYSYSYDTDGRNQRESVYGQDSWQPTDRLTINAGVRVDFVRGRSPALDKTVYSNTNWAPRLGFALDLAGDGKTVLKGHYGQYYEGIFSTMYDRAMPGYQDNVTYLYDPSGSFCGPAGNCFTEVDRLPYPVYQVDPDIKHPRVDEWTAGVERQIGKDVSLAITGIWRQDKNVQGSVYPDARWRPLTVTTSTDGPDPSLNGKTIGVYSWANRGVSESTGLLTNPDGFEYRDPSGLLLGTAHTDRTYKGLMIVLDKRFSDRWQGRVSYVLSKAEGYFSNRDWPPDTFGQSTLFETPTRALVNSYGHPDTDRTHEVKVLATYQVPKIELGLNAYYRFLSGFTYTPYEQFPAGDINYPVSSGRQPLLEPRGDRRLGNESTLDLRIEKIFKLRGTNRLSVYADIQNVFNAGTVIDVQNRHPLLAIPGQGTTVDIPFEAPSTICDPRRLILGARWSF
jgi:outer membrane receptor protein involved in Fe transport